ncbi:MAG: ABC transporter permease [Deltaproteobacteria bacterium]|nr:ABC transporter permease [Deltaproteobacteria bacterium]
MGNGVATETALAAAEQESNARGSYRALRRLAQVRTGWIGAALLLLAIAAALAAPMVAPYGFSEMSLAHRLQPPVWLSGGTSAHLLGTDPLGRDMLSRVIWAARTSLGIAGISVLVALVFGVIIGLLAGYYGGWLDSLMMRLADMQLSFPYLLLAIAVMALLKPTIANLIVVLALRSWVVYARTVRSSVLVAKQREFVEAAVALGASDLRIITRHLAPSAIAPIIVISSFQLAELIIAESSLSFLGLGVQPPTPSWGAMLSQGREYLTSAWWLGLFPGLAIILTVLGINLFGDALRDALDPRLKV